MRIDWDHFTPWASLEGGLLIGLAAGALMLVGGRILGVSNIIGGLLRPGPGEAGWRIAFLAGLLLSYPAFGLLGGRQPIVIDTGFPALALAGLLIGFGTRLGSGCTSGHGICGISRLSPRSILATGMFMLAGFATVFVLRHVAG